MTTRQNAREHVVLWSFIEASARSDALPLQAACQLVGDLDEWESIVAAARGEPGVVSSSLEISKQPSDSLKASRLLFILVPFFCVLAALLGAFR